MSETLDKIRENPKEFIKDVGTNLAVVLISLSYIAFQMVGLEKVTFDNPLILIAGAVLGIFSGVMIKQGLGENGFTLGYKSKDWLEAKRLYDNACNEAVPYMDKVDNFYQYQEIEKRLNYRRTLLISKRMKYDMWFDKDGNYIGTREMVKKLKWWQRIALYDAIRVRVHVNNLFSENSKSAREDVKKEKTDADQRAKSGAKNTLSAILIAGVNVAFTAFFKEFTVASILFATVQVALWLMFGFVNMYNNYNFVTKVKPANLATKKTDLKKFISGCENHLYDHSPYEQYEYKQIGMSQPLS